MPVTDAFRHCSWTPSTKISYFGATTGKELRMLSNFLPGANVVVDGITYRTTEAAYQSRLWPQEYRWWFGVDGPLDSFDAAVKAGFNFGVKTKEAVDKKIKFWDTRCGGAVGIIPKLLSNRKNRTYLSIAFQGQALPPPGDRHDFGSMSEQEFWLFILLQKFAHGAAKRLLVDTGSVTLVEFDKGATRHGSFWGGVYSKVTERVHGYNYMGRMLMMVRGKLQE